MVTISLADGSCRVCGGTLNVIDGGECSMLVECEECTEVYSVEPDAFGDEYWPSIMAELEGGR